MGIRSSSYAFFKLAAAAIKISSDSALVDFSAFFSDSALVGFSAVSPASSLTKSSADSVPEHPENISIHTQITAKTAKIVLFFIIACSLSYASSLSAFFTRLLIFSNFISTFKGASP